MSDKAQLKTYFTRGPLVADGLDLVTLEGESVGDATSSLPVGEQYANARLWAQGANLYFCLEYLLSFFNEDDPTVGNARAALAAARGEDHERVGSWPGAKGSWGVGMPRTWACNFYPEKSGCECAAGGFTEEGTRDCPYRIGNAGW
jgi:hypothetical protein